MHKEALPLFAQLQFCVLPVSETRPLLENPGKTAYALMLISRVELWAIALCYQKIPASASVTRPVIIINLKKCERPRMVLVVTMRNSPFPCSKPRIVYMQYSET